VVWAGTKPSVTEHSCNPGNNVTLCFYVSGYPDQQFTLDSSTNLKSWTTGPLLILIYGSGPLTFLTGLGANPPHAQFYRATLVP
jgi:hypothetical protein